MYKDMFSALIEQPGENETTHQTLLQYGKNSNMGMESVLWNHRWENI